MLTLFSGAADGLGTDISLDVPGGWLRRAGLDPRAVVRLRKAIGDAGADLLVAHGGEPAKYAALAANRETPLIYLNIGSAHPRLQRWHSRLIHRFYVTRSDAVVTVSRFLAEQAVEMHGMRADKVVVIPNGRDAAEFGPGPVSRDVPRLIWVGQLDATKRPELFISLVAWLEGRGLSVDALMVGDGPRMSELERMNSEARLELAGTRDDVADLLANSDLFVFTGRPPEGMPGVLIEAGMSGLAAVSTSVPGADEVIANGSTGLVVAVDDFDALCEAVQRLIQQPEVRREMGDKARERCVALFSFETTADQWMNLFDRLLETR